MGSWLRVGRVSSQGQQETGVEVRLPPCKNGHLKTIPRDLAGRPRVVWRKERPGRAARRCRSQPRDPALSLPACPPGSILRVGLGL